MDATQLTQTTAVNPQYGAGSAQGEGLSINPTYRGSLTTDQLNEVQKNMKKFLQAESETGVPWKVIASVYLAAKPRVAWPKSMGVTPMAVAKELVKSLPEKIGPNSSRDDIVRVASQMQSENLSQADINVALSYYDEIGSAFLGVQ